MRIHLHSITMIDIYPSNKYLLEYHENCW